MRSFILVVQVTLMIFMSSGVAFGKVCKPLLVLMEGGISSGTSMADLAFELRPIYNNRGIHVETPDNDDFWVGGPFNLIAWWIDESAFLKELNFIKRGNYNPIVIVGHSMGACIAYKLANRLPFTSLLVTLDPICYYGSKDFYYPKPERLRRWIHIYLKGNFLGIPDWVGPRYNADKNLHLWSSHFDLAKMYSHVRQDVENALSCR